MEELSSLTTPLVLLVKMAAVWCVEEERGGLVTDGEYATFSTCSTSVKEGRYEGK